LPGNTTAVKSGKSESEYTKQKTNKTNSVLHDFYVFRPTAPGTMQVDELREVLSPDFVPNCVGSQGSCATGEQAAAFALYHLRDLGCLGRSLLQTGRPAGAWIGAAVRCYKQAAPLGLGSVRRCGATNRSPRWGLNRGDNSVSRNSPLSTSGTTPDFRGFGADIFSNSFAAGHIEHEIIGEPKDLSRNFAGMTLE
jgi:hypothetical protein